MKTISLYLLFSLIIVFLIFIYSIKNPEIFTGKADSVPTITKDPIITVSLTDLLNLPFLYDNRMVKVKGYLTLTPFCNSLYINNKYSKGLNTSESNKNSVCVDIFEKRWLKFSLNDRIFDIGDTDFPPGGYYKKLFSELNGKEVEVTGIFNAGTKGSLNNYRGTIHQIEFIRVITRHPPFRAYL